MNIQERFAFLSVDKFAELVESNPFFNGIASKFLNGDLSKENIDKSGITEAVWVHDGDLSVEGEFDSIHDLSENIGLLFINGNMIVKENIYMANMDFFAVSGSIITESAIFQNVVLVVRDNLEVSKGIFFGDTDAYTEIRGSIETPRIVMVTDGEFKVNEISKNTLGIIGENSYSQKGDESIFRNLGLEKVIMVEECPEYKEAGNAFGTFREMVKDNPSGDEQSERKNIHTIDNLKSFCEGDGYLMEACSQDEINDALEHINTLPSLMIEYLQKIGYIWTDDFDIRSIGGTGYDFYSPAELKINGEYLIFGADMHGTENVAIKVSDLSQDNPPVYYMLEGYDEAQQEGTLFDCYYKKLVEYSK